jgi:antitoxin HicB
MMAVARSRQHDKLVAMKRKKSVKPPLNAAYLCQFRPEPEGGFTVTCPKLPPVVTYGETLEEAQANAREAIELCLEVMLEHGETIPRPDRDLTGPIDQLVPVGRFRG